MPYTPLCHITISCRQRVIVGHSRCCAACATARDTTAIVKCPDDARMMFTDFNMTNCLTSRWLFLTRTSVVLISHKYQALIQRHQYTPGDVYTSEEGAKNASAPLLI